MIYHFGDYDLEGIFEKDGFPKIHHVLCLELKRGREYYAMHSHPDRLEIIYVEDGEGVHTIGKHSYHTRPGDIIIFNQDVPHEEKAYEDKVLRFYGCAVTGLKLKGMEKNHLLDEEEKPVLHLGKEDESVRHIFRALFQESAEDDQMTRRTCSFLAAALIMKILDCRSSGGVKKKKKSQDGEIVRQVRKYLDEHYLERISLKQAANEAAVSPFYLDRVFKNKTGMSFKQYVISRKLGQAQSLLTDTEYSVAQIAEMVGYDNPSYFSQLFKKKFGITPGKYREKLRIIKR